MIDWIVFYVVSPSHRTEREREREREREKERERERREKVNSPYQFLVIYCTYSFVY